MQVTIIHTNEVAWAIGTKIGGLECMTLNGVMAIILHYFAEFGSFRANYVKLVEARPLFLLRNVGQRTYFPATYVMCSLQII